MSDAEDVDAMLEAALEPENKTEENVKKDKNGTSKSSNQKKHSRSRSRSRSNSRGKDKKKGKRSKSRDKHKHDRRHRSRSRDRRSGVYERSRYRDDRRRRSPAFRRRLSSPPRDITAGGRRLPGPERRDVMPFSARRSPPRNAKTDLTLEERDQRTVFIMQLSRLMRPRDLEEFFSSVGHVRDVRIITDSKTRRSKGIGYVEFYEVEAVALALGLNGQRLKGAPLIIQPTMAEKNRAAAGTVGGSLGFSNTPEGGSFKLYVGSLHFNIDENMLKGIFEPFGRIDEIKMSKDDKGGSKGYAHVTFHHPDDAKRAMEQLNGFELAGRPIKVGTAHELSTTAGHMRHLDSEDMDRSGVDLGTSGRLHLMAKLAEGTGMQLPQHAQTVLMQNQQISENRVVPAIATHCFMLSNMFDPAQESGDNWSSDIRDDVIDECSKNGGVLHIFVDKESPQGNVYVKCPTIAAAVGAVNSLHGRWFAGKVITANYVPVINYHQLFPDAMKALEPLRPAYQLQSLVGGQAGAIY